MTSKTWSSNPRQRVMTDFSISLHQDTCVVDSDDAVVPTAADESSLSDEEVLAGSLSLLLWISADHQQQHLSNSVRPRDILLSIISCLLLAFLSSSRLRRATETRVFPRASAARWRRHRGEW